MTGHCHRTLHIGPIESTLVFGSGVAAHLGEYLPARGCFVVTDDNVMRAHGDRLPCDLPHVVVAPGEGSKTVPVLTRVLDAMIDAGIDRSGMVVAFGGGVVGDLAGFAAATFMRGVRWVNVPTTLLAMVDASIGGKTAVDLPRGKNLMGAFHPPSLVLADPDLLDTLPAEEWPNGMAEVIKHAVVGSSDLFTRLAAGAFRTPDDIDDAIKVKVAVVERDPFERGERAVLNFGHTVGHGIERASGYTIPHGRAVAVGMVAEARLAEAIQLAPAGLAERLARVLARYELPSSTAACAAEVRASMTSDKKRVAGRLSFALPQEIGQMQFGMEVSEGVLMQVLEELCGTA